MARILTVIEGKGMVLESEDGILDAAYCKPTVFSGEAKINSYLNNGPIRDFNVIYDPVRFVPRLNLSLKPLILDQNRTWIAYMHFTVSLAV